jgi:hypothetical protein
MSVRTEEDVKATFEKVRSTTCLSSWVGTLGMLMKSMLLSAAYLASSALRWAVVIPGLNMLWWTLKSLPTMHRIGGSRWVT